MTFDGRAYTGASFIPPTAYHPNAPAVGHAAFSAMVSAYVASRYRGQLLGQQTYAQRWRYQAVAPSFSQTSYVDFAEFLNVHLPAHASHVGADVWFAHALGEETARATMRAVVTEGSNTDTGSATTFELDKERVHSEWEGFSLFRAQVEVALSSVVRPNPVRVQVQGYAQEPIAGTAREILPIMVTAWRFSR